MMWFGIIVGLLVFLLLNGLLASKASDIAEDKGYEKSTWFHMRFWLGLIAYIIVAAMPDRVMQGKVDQMINLLRTQNAASEAKKEAQSEDVDSFLPEL